MFGVNTSLIRFWEKEFKIIRPKKNTKGNRLFMVKDIEILHSIYTLVKLEGYTLEGAKKALKESKIVSEPADQHIEEVIEKLEAIKQKLYSLKSNQP